MKMTERKGMYLYDENGDGQEVPTVKRRKEREDVYGT